MTAGVRKSSDKQKVCTFQPDRKKRRSVFPIHLEGEMQIEMSGTSFVEADLSGG